MPGVPPILLDQAAQHRPQTGLPLGSAHVHALVEVTGHQDLGDRRSGALDRLVVEVVEHLGRVSGRRPELPVLRLVVAEFAPHGGVTLAREQVGEVVVLDDRQVLEQATEGQRGRAHAVRQRRRVEAIGLPAEGRAHPLDRREDLLGVGAVRRRLPGRCGLAHRSGSSPASAPSGACATPPGALKSTSSAATTWPLASAVRVNDQ